MSFRQHVTLGKSGLQVSRLGIASSFGVPAKAVEMAYREYGINYFYWGSIRRKGMGDAIRNLVSTERENIIIAIQSYDHIGWFLRRRVEKGLFSLGIDYTDVLILGWHNRVPSNRVLEMAYRLKEEGKVRHIALSGHNRKLFGELAQQENCPFDIFMIRYNTAHPGAEKDIFPLLLDKNRPGITTYTATCWGKLLSKRKMPQGEKPLTAPECYRFVLSNPDVDLCITGPKNLSQLKETLNILDKEPLSDEEMTRIRKIGQHVHENKFFF